MVTINDWETNKIIHKDKILYFDVLVSNNCIKQIKNGYFCLVESLEVCESHVLRHINSKLIQELKLEDVDKEIKRFIKQLNEYNELKDIGESLVHKIAERKGVTIKQEFIEMGFEDLSVSYD